MSGPKASTAVGENQPENEAPVASVAEAEFVNLEVARIDALNSALDQILDDPGIDRRSRLCVSDSRLRGLIGLHGERFR